MVTVEMGAHAASGGVCDPVAVADPAVPSGGGGFAGGVPGVLVCLPGGSVIVHVG